MHLFSSCGRSVFSALKHVRLHHLAVLVVAFVALSFGVKAQDATIVGTVTDPSGASVPNVKITVTNTETGLVHSAVTGDSGQYVLPELKIGHYDAKAEASGFKIAEQKGLRSPGRRPRSYRLPDAARRRSGNRHRRSQRSTRSERIPANRATLSPASRCHRSPSNGRSMYQLAALTPGASSQVQTALVNTPVGGDASVEFNGMRQNHNIYLLDGGEDDDRGGAGGMSIAPSRDAIAEFRALTSNYSADYGLVVRRHDDDGSQVRIEHAACVGMGIQPQRCVRCARLLQPGSSAGRRTALQRLRLQRRRPGYSRQALQPGTQEDLLLLQHGMAPSDSGQRHQRTACARSGDLRRQLQQRCHSRSRFRQRRRSHQAFCSRTAPAAWLPQASSKVEPSLATSFPLA